MERTWLHRLARHLLLLLLLGWIVALPWSALAQGGATDPATASQTAALKRDGDRAMDNLDFAKALALYEQALELTEDPVFLYNTGRALQGLDRYPEALDRLERFRRLAPPDLRARVPGLDELIANVTGNVATLTVESNVADARVLIRGKLVGKTPLRGLRVNAGSNAIEVFKDGYQPAKMNVSLAGGKARTVTFDLLSASSTGLLVVASSVDGAIVSVGGKVLGAVPAQTELPAGEHVVEVDHPDHEAYETTVVISAGETTRLDAPLEPSTPVYERWWFWTLAGALVVGGAVTGIVVAATTEGDPDSVNIPPGTVSVPLRAAPRRAGPLRAEVGLVLPVLRF